MSLVTEALRNLVDLGLKERSATILLLHLRSSGIGDSTLQDIAKLRRDNCEELFTIVLESRGIRNADDLWGGS